MSMQTSVLVDTLECNKCGLKEIFARTPMDEPILKCPKCGHTGVYVKIEFGYDTEQPAKETPKHPNDYFNLFYQADLLNAMGGAEVDEEYHHDTEGYDGFLEDGDDDIVF